MVWGCGRGYEKWDPPPRRLGSTWAGGEKLCQINLGREAEASLPKFICKPPPPHRRTVRPGVGVRFFFKDSPRSERSRRSLKKEDTRGPKGFLKTTHEEDPSPPYTSLFLDRGGLGGFSGAGRSPTHPPPFYPCTTG